LDEQHHTAYVAARENLSALARSVDGANTSWVRYNDLLTALEQLHAPEDLAEAHDVAGARWEYYRDARHALEQLRGAGHLDELEVGLLIGNLDQVWQSDPQADVGDGGS